MEQNQQTNYETKHQQRILEQKLLQRKREIKKFIKTSLITVLIAGPIIGLTWYAATRPPTPETDIVSKSGIHWHPTLTITVKGKNQEIPANIGLGVTEQTIHTHDNSGILHLEIQGLVKKEDIVLGRFFKIWGKQFTLECIFDSCNGLGGNVKMFVNGKENKEFDNYLMQDKDKIEIKYE